MGLAMFNPCRPCCTPAGCRYSVTATLAWGDNADLALYGANDTAGAVCYYGTPSAGGLSLNLDAHPACSPTPLPPEIITGEYTSPQAFRFWYNQRSGCSPQIAPSVSQVQVKNTGGTVIWVNDLGPLLPGGSFTPPGVWTGPIDFAGYATGDQSGFVDAGVPPDSLLGLLGYVGVNCGVPGGCTDLSLPDALFLSASGHYGTGGDVCPDEDALLALGPTFILGGSDASGLWQSEVLPAGGWFWQWLLLYSINPEFDLTGWTVLLRKGNGPVWETATRKCQYAQFIVVSQGRCGVPFSLSFPPMVADPNGPDLSVVPPCCTAIGISATVTD